MQETTNHVFAPNLFKCPTDSLASTIDGYTSIYIHSLCSHHALKIGLFRRVMLCAAGVVHASLIVDFFNHKLVLWAVAPEAGVPIFTTFEAVVSHHCRQVLAHAGMPGLCKLNSMV